MRRHLKTGRAGTLRAAWISLALLGAALPSARAQEPCPDCPVLDPVLEVSSQRITLLWDEAPATEGRRTSNLRPSWINQHPQADSSSTVEILGDYALDCDYRLTLSKIPEPVDAESLTVRIRYEIRENRQGTGAAIDADTVRVAQPDSIFPLEPRVAGNLGIRFSPNINQPSSPLGTIPVTLSGLNTSNSISSRYSARALNTVTSLSDGLMVEVRGPLSSPRPVVVSFSVDTPGQVFPIMNGMEISFGDGMAAAGDSVLWSSRFLFPSTGNIALDMEAFEGYHVWRATLPDLSQFTLLGEIRQCDSKFDFILINEEEFNETDIELFYDDVARTFQLNDFNIHDDFPYRYAVSTFDRGFLGNDQGRTFEGTLARTEIVYPARQGRDPMTAAYVVPNPYKRRSAFQQGQPKVVFSNLPDRCTIRVFTEAADLVTTIEHGPGIPGSTSPTSREWNLTSDRGVPIAPGIYIYYIEGEFQGKPFEQADKLIVVR